MTIRRGFNNSIADALNLPRLDEVLEQDMAEQPEPEIPEQEVTVTNSFEENLKVFEGQDHAKAMDEIYKDTLDHSRSLMDLGFNVDDRSRRGIFEVAAAMYKNAIDAKNSKRDYQLKLMKLILDQKKLDMDRRVASGGVLPTDIQANVVVEDQVEEDRNEIIRKMREDMEKDKS